jgi:hypothetical protein
VSSDNSVNSLWKDIKSFMRKRSQTGSIAPHKWHDHFKSLLENASYPIDEDFEEEVSAVLSSYDENYTSGDSETELCTDELDNDITEQEVYDAIHQMKNNKAGGPDGLVIEMYKNACDMVPHVTVLFNMILRNGVFPEEWCRAVICPLHKKGDTSVPGNYRGISLLNTAGKIFTKIVNERLTHWAEMNSKLYEQ